MNIRKPFLGALVLTGLVGILTMPKASAEFNLDGVTQQLQNHEARITNNEKDITKLQDNTNTPPAVDHVSVPVVESAAAASSPLPVLENSVNPATQEPTPTSPPKTKTITAISNDWPKGLTTISNDAMGDPKYCGYTYSDGSTSGEVVYPKINQECLAIGTVVPAN